ncbi:EF-hand domain-containing protein [Alcanivorax sp. JB21]|uniref:EF-hand domain-containing protein n=1 Tax=Alcanivorax limicola TaxID=2874102 RepID=UPI001CBF8B4D|nr:EF-hand domain-containing protein [Alcanivorax limicola]MBZ2187763.1 EF-hand domain-containing protein [Alcanivorax limicola]
MKRFFKNPAIAFSLSMLLLIAAPSGAAPLILEPGDLLSREQAADMRAAAFRELDKGNKGYIVPKDLASGDTQAAESQKAWFLRMDINGDGRVTREEMEAAMAPMFDALDDDGDGYIEIDEWIGKGPYEDE